MGEFASTVQEHLRDGLAQEHPEYDWSTEKRIAGTPVDIAGEGAEETLLVELKWRRADPADNAAKLFRHLSTGELQVESVRVFQVFLANGGVSSKRKNAEFVGKVAPMLLAGFSTRQSNSISNRRTRRGVAMGWKETASRTIGRIETLS